MPDAQTSPRRKLMFWSGRSKITVAEYMVTQTDLRGLSESSLGGGYCSSDFLQYTKKSCPVWKKQTNRKHSSPLIQMLTFSNLYLNLGNKNE